MKIIDEHILLKNSSILMRKERNGKYMIFSPNSRGLHFIEKNGHDILKLCNGNNNVGEIISLISNRVKLSSSNIKDYILKFFENMVDRGVLQLKK